MYISQRDNASTVPQYSSSAGKDTGATLTDSMKPTSRPCGLMAKTVSRPSVTFVSRPLLSRTKLQANTLETSKKPPSAGPVRCDNGVSFILSSSLHFSLCPVDILQARFSRPARAVQRAERFFRELGRYGEQLLGRGYFGQVQT